MSKSQKKVLIIGNVNSGKTWLWQSYFQNRQPNEYTQTIFDNYCSTLTVEGKVVSFSLFDTCGEDDYSQLRQLMYQGADVIIFCVAIDDPKPYTAKSKTLSSSLEKWYQELKQFSKGIPILLVGTKADLRDDPEAVMELAAQKIKPLKMKDLIAISKKIKAINVLECSAKSGEGLSLVFHTALKLALKGTLFKR